MKTVDILITDHLQQKYLLKTNQNQVIDLRFIHDHPHTSSNISICIIASGQAKVKLNATITINSTAHDATAWLEIIVITRDQAMVTAAPNLKIGNNQVQAGHALTTKHLTDQELFYLTSRGIDKEQAAKLIINSTLAKFNDSIDLANPT